MLLIGVEFKEWVGQRLNWEIRARSLGSFNLIVGDNAQGKTRLFNIMKFMRDVNMGAVAVTNAELKIAANLSFSDGNARIGYELNLSFAAAGKPVFNEVIIRDNRTLFSRTSKTLLDETSDKEIKDFFISESSSAVFTLTEPKFQTIGKIRSFIERMLFLEANRSAQIIVAPNAQAVDTKGHLIGSVLDTWRSKSKPSYEEVTAEFERLFSFIEKGSISSKPIQIPNSLPGTILTMREPSLAHDIPQNDWSDGMSRALALLALPATRFPQSGQEGAALIPPSFIFVDEIENGLDFKTLNGIIAFYKDHSNLTQMILSSHSPLVCNMIKSSDWRIARRHGSSIEFPSVTDKEIDLDKKREDLFLDNWEFYKTNIAAKKKV